MDTQTPPQPVQNAPKGYISLPPEVDEAVQGRFFSAKFVVFAIFVISAAAVAGSAQSGRISLSKYLKFAKMEAMAPASGAPAAAVTPVPVFKADAFVVTSISAAEPPFAIINGVSHTVGDTVEAPGVTGWSVREIGNGRVWFQNGSSVASVAMTTPGLNPLNDQLHPLN